MGYLIKRDSWEELRKLTEARIALGRAGTSIPIRRELEFRLAHAHARDAVHSEMDTKRLVVDLSEFGIPVFLLQSQAPDRAIYLQRPDLGRIPAEKSMSDLVKDSFNDLNSQADDHHNDLCIVVADGLSANAINKHVACLLKELMPMFRAGKFQVANICLVSQGRVAIADHIGFASGSLATLMLIGERPGLTAPDSIGAYITHNPRPGLTDESRNCVSNIRPGGLAFLNAAQKIYWLLAESKRLGYSGVQLKDNTPNDFTLLP